MGEMNRDDRNIHSELNRAIDATIKQNPRLIAEILKESIAGLSPENAEKILRTLEKHRLSSEGSSDQSSGWFNRSSRWS